MSYTVQTVYNTVTFNDNASFTLLLGILKKFDKPLDEISLGISEEGI